MEGSKILDVMTILIHCEVDDREVRNLTVNWWVDDGETTSEPKFQDVD